MTQIALELPAPAAGNQPAADRPTSALGVGLCLLSAVAFGLAALFGKQCFAAGFSVSSMLVGRFGIAALVFWLIVAIRRPALPGPRLLLTCLALGGVGYALQAACYFSALTRIDASLVGQILYVYPAVVVVLGLALRRETASRRKLAALGCSLSGLVLLLGYAGSNGPVAPAGVMLAFCSALTYALYITVANGLPEDFDVYLLSALVCSSAAVSVGLFGLTTGSLQAPAQPSGWLWLAPLSLVSSVIAIGCFLGGLRLVGASTAAILSCLEPVVTAASAIVVFGERFNAGQVVGAAVVLAAVVLLRPAVIARGEASSGQLQRVAVARGLAERARYVLADEPTSELDALNRGRVMGPLRAEARRGAGVLVATHDPEAAALCDAELRLDEGHASWVREERRS